MPRLGVLVLTLVAASACSHSQTHGTPTAQAGVVADSAPGVTARQTNFYSTEATADVLAGDAATASMRGALQRACAKAGLSPDGRLAQLAEIVAKASQQGHNAPRGSFVSFEAHRAGLIEPTPQLWMAGASRMDMLEPELPKAVAETAKASRLTHCGGALVHERDMFVMVVAFVGRFVRLEAPFPKSVEPGVSVELSADLARGYQKPSLAVTAPDGKVLRKELPNARTLRDALPFSAAGEHTVEILAEGPDGLSVLAVFPVMAGGRLPDAAPDYAAESAETDAPSVGRHLLQLINAERRKKRLKALEQDPRLERIALAHSEDMAAHHFVGHTSKRTGEPSDRVAAAGLKARVVLENIGRAYSAAEIHDGLMESPGHRANILHPDARLLGIGVVAEPEGDRQAFLVTELFAELEATGQDQRR